VSLSCTVLEILSPIFLNLKTSRDSEHISIWVNIIMLALVLMCVTQHTKLIVSSFTNYKDMTEGKI